MHYIATSPKAHSNQYPNLHPNPNPKQYPKPCPNPKNYSLCPKKVLSQYSAVAI